MMNNLISSGKKALAVLGLIVIAYLILDMNYRVASLLRLSSERDAMATQVFVVKQTEQALETRIAYANSDAAAEKWAREEAFMARPGDHPIIMLPDPQFTPAPVEVPVVTQEAIENWQVWSLLFFGEE